MLHPWHVKSPPLRVGNYIGFLSFFDYEYTDYKHLGFVTYTNFIFTSNSGPPQAYPLHNYKRCGTRETSFERRLHVIYKAKYILSST